MNSFTLCRLASGLLLAALSVSAQAAQVTDTTSAVEGRAPFFSRLEIVAEGNSAITPVLGDTLELKYVLTDWDGDAEHETLIQWFVDGVLIARDVTTVVASQPGAYSAQIFSVTDCRITFPCDTGWRTADPIMIR